MEKAKVRSLIKYEHDKDCIRFISYYVLTVDQFDGDIPVANQNQSAMLFTNLKTVLDAMKLAQSHFPKRRIDTKEFCFHHGLSLGKQVTDIYFDASSSKVLHF